MAGGNGQGSALNQLYWPHGFDIDDDNQSIVIADRWNHRIVEWEFGASNGRVIAGGQGRGNRLDQFSLPTDVLIHKETNSLFICDHSNRRVVRWSRRQGTTQGEVIVDNVLCLGLAIDHQGFLYVSDTGRDQVRRYTIGGQGGCIIAGGNERGSQSNQLNFPTYLFVDEERAVYVSDSLNNRVMKWSSGAHEGIVVAGGQGRGNALTQLNSPEGLLVDTSGTVYVADATNNRLMRWRNGEQQGTTIVGGNGLGSAPNQFRNPKAISFDSQHNLYVIDPQNNRVQRFNIQ